ncbi:THAP domain-containing protein 11-like [Hydractinia symbiolongicarpus]|uniref:THAP domain-containing protein 11-like n=1 Tax=Hydractinia symbiolongicarpus TaxID=13093 RepID=UPI00254B8D70|nr:THAP domain-containing protein 11-like [Hydractinia symbiolongicarpus]
MPSTCCAVGCTNRKTEESSLHFYRIPPPSNPERRQKWIVAVGRKDWHELQINNARLCSEHFISGNKSENKLDPDYIPTRFFHLESNERTFHQKKKKI